MIIAVLTRAPVPGRCKTRLIPALGEDGAAALHRAMLEDVLAELAELPASRRVILVTPEDDGVAALRTIAGSDWEVRAQVGGDLTEKLTEALTALNGPVVFFGSDAPLLELHRLREPLSRVEADSSRALICPCADGGYTAISLWPSGAGLLTGIPWSTNAVSEATRRRAETLGITLEEQDLGDDVDEPADLVRLERELALKPSRAASTRAALRAIRS